MKLTTHRRADATVLALKGEFDGAVCEAFLAEVARGLRDGPPCLVLNLARVKFVNTSGLGAVLKARAACRRLGGDLALSQPTRWVREAIEATGLDRVLIVSASDGDAYAALACGCEPALA